MTRRSPAGSVAPAVLLLACLAASTGAAKNEPRAPADAATPEPATGPDGGDDAAAPRASGRLPVYRPPRRGAPRAKVGSGPGRNAPALPTLLTLAPPHVARTVSAAPSLFWHVDGVVSESQALRFTLLDPRQTQPLVEADLSGSAAPGIGRVRLADLAVLLEPGVEYEWSVALVAEEGEGEVARLDRGFVLRIDPPIRLRGAGSVHTYADLGLWYDALETAIDALERAPERADLREQRDALLRQAGLEAATRPPSGGAPRAP